VASLDEGYYGRGMYFTSHLSYAAGYAPPTPQGRVFLVSLVIPGNTFPVTEFPNQIPKGPAVNQIPNTQKGSSANLFPNSYKGKPCRKGYQSHYVEVIAIGNPIVEEGVARATEAVADEMVVFEASQTLPLFLVYSHQEPESNQVAEWKFLNDNFGEKEGKLEELKLLFDPNEEHERGNEVNTEKVILRDYIKKLEGDTADKERELQYLRKRVAELEDMLLRDGRLDR